MKSCPVSTEGTRGSMWRSCLAPPAPWAVRSKQSDRDQLVVKLLDKQRSLNPFAFHLAQVEWSVFGTLTWRQEALTRDNSFAERLRRCDFRWLVNMTCGRLRLRPRHFLIYRKTEWGPTRQGHYNFLIAKRGTKNVPPQQLADTLQSVWTDGHKGRALVEPFDSWRHLAGVSYQSKREFDSSGNELWQPEEFSKPLQRLFRENTSSLEPPPHPTN